MSDTPDAPTAAVDLRDAVGRLDRAHGAGELQAALLALLLPRGSKRARRAWQIETNAAPGADALRACVAALPGPARLAWFDALLARMAAQPLAARQGILQATRRVMGARGVARPIDRLHWLAMRRGLGETSAPAPTPSDAQSEVAEWLESDVLAVAVYTAFLSRMVPGEEADGPDGQAWYDAAMSTWQPFADIPAWEPPNAEAMVEALAKMQTLSWVQRPVIVRTWATAAQSQSRGLRFTDLSADALRLSCDLLDSPMPPELEHHFALAPGTAPSR